MKDCQQENIFDEQKIFRQMNVKAFFERQAVHDRKNREKRTECYTKAFKDAFSSLLEKDWESARTALNCGFFSRKWLRALLYEEFEWHSRIFEQELPQAEAFYAVFGSSSKNFLNFVQKVRQSLPYDKAAAKSYAEFLSFKKDIELYQTFPVKNIAVCATMSAGKSSFVNALLGYDFLPARNEATTAKITSVYDNDSARRLIGFTTAENKIISISENLSNKILDEWNADSSVQHIFLQGNLDNIGNHGMVVAVHDTPGTNNSGDEAHHKITFDFLAQNKMDVIVYVANAEHIATTDEKALLSELYEKVVKKNNVQPLFVLNKADGIDTEKESLDSIVKAFKEELHEIGFADADLIFPVSARAARLLKIALWHENGRENLTEKEKDDFPAVVKKFGKRISFDDTNYSDSAFGSVVVDGEEYQIQDLLYALHRTGITKIEKTIESLCERRNMI